MHGYAHIIQGNVNDLVKDICFLINWIRDSPNTAQSSHLLLKNIFFTA